MIVSVNILHHLSIEIRRSGNHTSISVTIVLTHNHYRKFKDAQKLISVNFTFNVNELDLVLRLDG